MFEDFTRIPQTVKAQQFDGTPEKVREFMAPLMGPEGVYEYVYSRERDSKTMVGHIYVFSKGYEMTERRDAVTINTGDWVIVNGSKWHTMPAEEFASYYQPQTVS